MTVLYHQTFSPSTCDCVIEEQFEHDEETGLNSEPTLWFFHHICDKHISLVENKPKLSLKDWNNQKDKIIKHHEFLLADNRKRHLKTFDENPQRKQRAEAIKQMKESKLSERHAESMQIVLDSERTRTLAFLDNHEIESMDKLLTGLHSKYALIGQDVYAKIREEQKQANPIIENDG